MPEDESYQLTLAEMKRQHRMLSRAHAKLRRKVETMRKLRTATAKLSLAIGDLKYQEKQLRDVRWEPPSTSHFGIDE